MSRSYPLYPTHISGNKLLFKVRCFILKGNAYENAWQYSGGLSYASCPLCSYAVKIVDSVIFRYKIGQFHKLSLYLAAKTSHLYIL